MEGESPDGIAMIGPAPDVPGLFHCCGFTGHGFAISPEVGAVVGAWLATGTPPYDMALSTPPASLAATSPTRVLPMGTIDFTRNEAAQQPG